MMGSPCMRDRDVECLNNCEHCSQCIREQCAVCGEWYVWDEMEWDLGFANGPHYCKDCYEKKCEAEFEEESA